jgi:hypothetical protein
MSRRSTEVLESPITSSPTITVGLPTDQDIAVRAHQIFLDRGSIPGHDFDDWLQAERELIAASVATPTSQPKAQAAASNATSRTLN